MHELTASLARIAAAQQRDYPKPLKWFEIGRCFRYEKPQRGRLREFYQFNADILGEPSAGEWTLEVVDGDPGGIGSFVSWQLNVYGTGAPTPPPLPIGWGNQS